MNADDPALAQMVVSAVDAYDSDAVSDALHRAIARYLSRRDTDDPHQDDWSFGDYFRAELLPLTRVH